MNQKWLALKTHFYINIRTDWWLIRRNVPFRLFNLGNWIRKILRIGLLLVQGVNYKSHWRSILAPLQCLSVREHLARLLLWEFLTCRGKSIAPASVASLSPDKSPAPASYRFLRNPNAPSASLRWPPANVTSLSPPFHIIKESTPPFLFYM